MRAVKTTKSRAILGMDSGDFWLCIFWSSLATRFVLDASQDKSFTTMVLTAAVIAAVIATSVALSRVMFSGASSELDGVCESCHLKRSEASTCAPENKQGDQSISSQEVAHG